MSIKHIYQSLKRPTLWAPSPEPFWNDEHISKGMLAAHINPDFDGASRKTEFMNNSAQWIAEICAPVKGKKLLDLGCGPGLYAAQFHKAGFIVSGVDISPRSIEYAKKYSPLGIIFKCADYLKSDLPESMDAVTMIYCDFGVLPPEARQWLLCRIFHVLKPGGRLIFDVFTRKQYQNFKEQSTITEHDRSGFWADEPHIVLERRLAYPEDRTFLHLVGIATENAFKRYHIWEHVFRKRELQKALREVGFSTIEFYGDVSGRKLSLDSKTFCVVAQKTGQIKK